jgi:ribonuclease R
MKTRIGQRFKGHIQGYSAKVMFVTLDSPFVEVGVPLAALGGNFWVDEHRIKATGLRGSVVLTIGDPVETEITAVDEDLRRVSAWLTEAKAQDGHGKAVAFVPMLAAPATLREGDLEKPRRGRAAPREVISKGRPPKKTRVPAGKARGVSGKTREASSRPEQERRATAGEARDPEGARPRTGRVKPPKGSVRGIGKRKGR